MSSQPIALGEASPVELVANHKAQSNSSSLPPAFVRRQWCGMVRWLLAERIEHAHNLSCSLPPLLAILPPTFFFLLKPSSKAHLPEIIT